MTEHDRNNLNFLLTIDDNSLAKWFETASDDDIIYAFELIQEYKDKMKELYVEYDLQTSDLKEANDILEKFKL